MSSAQIITSGYSTNNPQIQLGWIEWFFIVLFFYFIGNMRKYFSFVIWNIIKILIPETDLFKRYSAPENQTWAVVTGATDGIGLGFCEQLIARGFNVCLVSRNQQKISKVIEKLQKQKPDQFKDRKIKGIQFDCTNSQDTQKFQKFWSQLDKLDIGVFVNNVGFALVKRYQECQFKEVVDLINVNCVTMACLNARLVNKMKQRKAKSAIINLSSLAGINPIPYITLYSSSKAFNRILSEGLSIEYPEMDILAITPMHVESGSSNVKKQFNIPTSRECARDSLKQLRFGEYNSFGYLMHNITGTALLTFMPKWFLRIVSNIEMKKLIEKYYSKKE